MTSLNFLLTRALGRTARARRRDRLHAARPRRERRAVAGARSRTSASSSASRACTTISRSTSTTSSRSSPSARASSPSRSRRTRSGRRRTSRASSSSRTAPARSPGRTPSTTGRTARSTSRAGTSTCSSARRTSTSARTWGSRSASGSSSRACSPYKVRPVGQLPGREPLPARHAAARAARRLRRRGRVRRVARLGGDRRRTRRCSGSASSTALPDAVELYGLRTMEGRVPTFAFNLPGRSSEEVAIELAAREIAVWHGDYYAIEIMKLLGLEGTGAVRAGFVHYNTAGRGRPAADRARRAVLTVTELLQELIRFDTTNPPGNESGVHRVRARAARGGGLRDDDLREGPGAAEPRQPARRRRARRRCCSRATSTSSRPRDRSGRTRRSRRGSRTATSGAAARST